MRKGFCTIWLIPVVVLSGTREVEAREYRTTILGTLGGDHSSAYAINDLGQIGGSSTTAEAHTHAFIWEDGVMTDLGAFGVGRHGVEVSCATGINNLRQVVGHSSYNNSDIEHPAHAFLWQNGQMSDIGTLGGNSYATAINNQGEVVGYCEGSQSCAERGFLWSNEVMIDIGTLEGGRTYACGLNDKGQVVGQSYTSNGYNAFMWDNGQMINLGTVDQYGSVATGINNLGDVVGSITGRQSYIRQEAVLWHDETIMVLGYLDVKDPRSYGHGINESGQIVGCSLIRAGASNPTHACLWENGQIIDLDRFVGPDFGATYAYSINNSGQIVGCAEMVGGTAYRAFLMTPVPSVYYVDAVNGNDEKDGLSPHTAFATIQKGIDAALNGDTVIVAPGMYTGEGNRDIVLRRKKITVKSESGPEHCIIDCNGAVWDFHWGFYVRDCENSATVIDGFTIINGYQTRNGGGGGGFRILDSNCLITNCWLFKHNGVHGGAIRCTTSNPKITNCLFENNHAWKGSGIYCNNSSTGWCPGPRNGGPEISNCLFVRNIARMGGFGQVGTIFCFNSDTVIRNCTLADNNHGIFVHQGDVEITSCILQNKNYEIETPDWLWPTVKVANCFVRDFMIREGDNSSISMLTGNIYSDPCFVRPGYWDPNDTWVRGDYHLHPMSPCIDTGDPSFVPEVNETDIDGQPRVLGGRVDMGADEFVIEVPMTLTPRAFNPCSQGKWLKAHLVLPEEFALDDVDTDTPATLRSLGTQIESEHMNVFVNEDGAVEVEAAFDRAAFCNVAHNSASGLLNTGVEGLLTSGRPFYGTDTIRIINHDFRCLANFVSHWLQTDCQPPDWCSGSDLNHDSVVNFVDLAILERRIHTAIAASQ